MKCDVHRDGSVTIRLLKREEDCLTNAKSLLTAIARHARWDGAVDAAEEIGKIVEAFGEKPAKPVVAGK